jgi:8-oxo-dGTP diphosphatase
MEGPTTSQTLDDRRPRIGIGVIVVRANKEGGIEILLGKRKKEFGRDKWAFPGGHLEYKETWAECALRELKEETGLDFSSRLPFFIGATNDIEGEFHYVTLYVGFSGIEEDEAQNLEPHKCAGWDWFNLTDGLPKDLWLPVKEILETESYRIIKIVPDI